MSRWTHYAYAAALGAALAVSGISFADWRWWLLFGVALAWREHTRYALIAELEKTP